MKLRDLVAGIATVQRPSPAGAATPADPSAIDIAAITDDSRRVVPGCLFVARPGTACDGRTFVCDAIARGAIAVLYDDSDGAGDPCPPESTVVRVKLNPPRAAAPKEATPRAAAVAGAAPAAKGAAPLAAAATPMAIAACRLAERLEGEPSEWLSLIGITGTNGKTTMAFLVQQFVREAGSACGVIGTVLVDDGGTAEPADLTTPSGIAISAALGRMVRNGCCACAIEVSSHALDQGRASALRFKTAIFSNLTGDHLDYHLTMEEYAAAKARLFAMLPADGTAVVNADDAWHERMVQGCRARVLRCTVRDERVADHAMPASAEQKGADRPGITRYGYPGPSPDLCVATIHEARLGWQDVSFSGPFATVRVALPLVGRHNAMNALQAAVAAHSIGIPEAAIHKALAACAAPPGRLEPVTTPDDPFAVLVDYAHTDDALLNVLTALRPLVGQGGRLTVVFGCGGDRDRTKRPRMMQVAAAHADRIIVTSDNPRTEEPEAIIDEILAGRPAVPAGAVAPDVRRQADRARAIELAVAEARPGDIVLIAGKGHEDYQIIGTTKRPFDDRIVARAALGRGDAGAAGGRAARMATGSPA